MDFSTRPSNVRVCQFRHLSAVRHFGKESISYRFFIVKNPANDLGISP